MFIFVKMAKVPLQNIEFHWERDCVIEREETFSSSRVLSMVSSMFSKLPISLIHSTLVVKASLKKILRISGTRDARTSLVRF